VETEERETGGPVRKEGEKARVRGGDGLMERPVIRASMIDCIPSEIRHIIDYKSRDFIVVCVKRRDKTCCLVAAHIALESDLESALLFVSHTILLLHPVYAQADDGISEHYVRSFVKM